MVNEVFFGLPGCHRSVLARALVGLKSYTRFMGRGGLYNCIAKGFPDVETGPLKQPDGNLEGNL